MASGPQNAVVGDDSFGTNLPQTEVPEQDLSGEINMAKFSQTKEYQVLKDFIDTRINYYQRYLPGNVPAENVPDEERGKYWAIACVIIDEFRAITQAYENASQAVQDSNV